VVFSVLARVSDPFLGAGGFEPLTDTDLTLMSRRMEMKEFMGISLGVHVFFMGVGKMVGCFICSCAREERGCCGLTHQLTHQLTQLL
jgi:hypothetical protein